MLQHLARVLLHHLNQAQFVPAFGSGNRDQSFAFLAQPGLYDNAVVRLHLDHQFRWNVWRTFVKLLQEGSHHLAGAAIARPLQDKEFAPNQLAVAEKEDHDAGLILATGESNHILVVLSLRGNDALLLQHPLNRLDAVAHARRLLEVQVLCRRLHLLLQGLHHLVMLPLQEEDHLLDHRVVLFPRGISDTGSNTAVDIILRARAWQQLLPPPLERLTLRRWRPRAGIVAAGAEGKKLVQEVQRGIDRPRIGIGTEVAVAVVVKTTHAVDPGEILRQ